MISAKREICIEIGILVGIGVLFRDTLDIPAPRFEPMGSAVMPQGLLIIMAILALINLVKAIVRWRIEPNTDEYKMVQASERRNLPPESVPLIPIENFDREVIKRTLITLALLMTYTTVLTLDLVNYYVASFVFATFLSGYLGLWRKKYIAIGAITICCILGLLFMLAKTMGLILPNA